MNEIRVPAPAAWDAERFRSIIDSLPEAVFETDAAGLWTYLSPAWTGITGFPVEESLGRSFLDFVHPDDRQGNLEMFPLVAGGNESWRREARCLSRDGGFRWVDVRAHLVLDEHGAITGTSGTLADVTERREASEQLRSARHRQETLLELERRVSERTADLERLNEALLREIGERRTVELALARSEQHFRALIENTLDVILLIDAAGVVRYASPSLERVLGHDPVRVAGSLLADLVAPGDGGHVKELLHACLERPGAQAPVLFRFPDAAGACRLVCARLNNQTWNPGVRSVIVTLSDVTEQQRTEQELRENEERYRLLFQASTDGIVLLGPDRRICDCNAAACRMFDYDRGQMLGLDFGSLMADGAAAFETWSDATPGAGSVAKSAGRTSAGRLFPLEIRGRTIIVGGERIVIAFIRDMTEREAAERTLRQSEQRYRAFVEGSAEAIWRIDIAEPFPTGLPEEQQIERIYASGYVAECNDAMARMYGFSRASEMVGTSVERMLPRSLSSSRNHLLRLIRSGYRLSEDESWEPDRGGRMHWFVSNIVGLIENGRIERLWGTQRDVTDRKAAEAEVKAAQAALRESEALYRSLVETSPDAILLLRPDHRIGMLNPQAVSLFGFRGAEEARGRSIVEFVDQCDRERTGYSVRARLGSRESMSSLEMTLVKCSGERFPAEVSASKIAGADGVMTGILAVIRDVSDRKQAEASRKYLEEQFRQAQKLEAVGRLAGGVAHDFNNLLTVITGYCELLLKRAAPDSPIRRNLGQIKKASDRAAALVQQLLAFSRKQLVEARVLDLRETVSDLQKMLRRLIGEDIELVTDLDPQTGWIKADPGQIEQMIMNLTVNARDAMPDGGTIAIRTERRDIREPGDVPAGTWAVLSVKDNGVGMSPEVRSRVFEPFFTTKEVGKGTGLGLSTVYGIVRQSGGHISVESEPGKGTEFRVYFPAVLPGAESSAGEECRDLPPGRSETILLVEDEEMVREMARETLEERGYRVLEARNGEHAIEVAERHPDRIDLLLTDIVMPRVGGREVAEALLQRRPGIRVLYMSGYADKDLGQFSPLLRKPFTPDELAHRVQALIAG